MIQLPKDNVKYLLVICLRTLSVNESTLILGLVKGEQRPFTCIISTVYLKAEKANVRNHPRMIGSLKDEHGLPCLPRFSKAHFMQKQIPSIGIVAFMPYSLQNHGVIVG